MKEYLPYIVTLICSALSFIASIWVCKKNNKVELEKAEQCHKNELEKMKQEFENKMALIEKEYALKAGTQIVTDFADKTMEAIYSSSTVKEEINKQAFRSFTSKKTKRR